MIKSESRLGTIWSVQYLRAAAAIAVVIFHQLQGFDPIFRLGLHGVDMFFVISGFIMFVLTHERNVTPTNFALDRIARIVPPYWLATILTFVSMLAGAPTYNGSTDLKLLASSMLFIPTLNEFGVVQPTLYLGWTLNFEMFFYTIFAIIMFMSRGRLVAVSFLLILLVLAGMVLRPESAIGTTYTSPQLLEFLSGVELGALFGIGLDRFAAIVQISGSILIAVVLAVMSLYHSSLAFGAISVIILTICLTLERIGRMPRSRLAKNLGDASFAIYLFQQFAFEAVSAGSRATGGWAHGIKPAMSIIAAVALGVVVLRYVERPLTKHTKRQFRRWTKERLN